MIRKLAVATLALALAACATAHRPGAPANGAAPANAAAPAKPLGWGDDPGDRAPGPLLFQVEAPGGRIDLFGTMHTEPLSSLPKAAAERYAAAHTVAFEVDIQHVSVRKILAMEMLPPDQSLDQLLGPEAWQRLTKYLEGTMPAGALKRFRPWFAFVLILKKATAGRAGAQTMDAGMLKQGRADKKTVRFLETADEQLALLDETIDAAALIKITGVLDQLQAALEAMTSAYRGGDVTAVETVVGSLDQRTGMSTQQARAIFGERNERWVPFLEELAAGGGAFVAVGAGHLVGKDGLVGLLRARGYRVTRVR